MPRPVESIGGSGIAQLHHGRLLVRIKTGVPQPPEVTLLQNPAAFAGFCIFFRDIKRVDELGKHLKAYEDYMSKLGNALGTTVNHYNTAYKEMGKLDKDVTRITGTTPGLEVSVLDKPKFEE